MSIYRDFGFDDVVRQVRGPPAEAGGRTRPSGTSAEAALKAATKAAGIEYTLNPGEGAFYGPKLEFVLKDAIGRDWQCGTLQVDLNLPGRLGAHYIDDHEPEAHAGHAAPGDLRLAGAVLRDPAGAPRRQACRPGCRRSRPWS